MKKIITILSIALLTSCAHIPSPFTPSHPDDWMNSKKNACLPTAIAFRESLKKYNVWAKVVTYRYHDAKTKEYSGHAIVAYMYPTGKNKLWTYDHWGSYRARAYIDDPLDIAQKAVDARHENERYILVASFLE